MYYEFDDYFEPGEFDEKIEELKNELRESVKKEINDEIEKLRKENKELQGMPACAKPGRPESHEKRDLRGRASAVRPGGSQEA